MATLTTDQAKITERPAAVAEEVLSGPLGDGPWEIYLGRVVELKLFGLSVGEVVTRVLARLFQFCEDRDDLEVLGSNAGFLLRRNPDTLLSPKAALFRSERAKGTKEFPEFSPDLVVEIVTPDDSLRIVQMKVGMYLNAGSEQVWIVDPQRKILEVRYADGRTVEARDGIYTATGIAEGLKVDLRELFKEAEIAEE